MPASTSCARRCVVLRSSYGSKADARLAQPFTFDAQELQELVDLAKEKKRFLMEAVWTRFVSECPAFRYTTYAHTSFAAPHRQAPPGRGVQRKARKVQEDVGCPMKTIRHS